MSCSRCGTEHTNKSICLSCQESIDLKCENTVLKAERDEAIRTRDEVHQQLMNLLAVIHRDGGQYVGRHGVEKALEDAFGLLAMRNRHSEPDDNPKNRMELARMRAGLSPTQAAQMFGLERDELIRMEREPEISSEWNTKMFAAYYGVSVEWLTGQVPRFNYDAMKDIAGYDDLTQHDKDTLAEFAASLPPNLATAKERMERAYTRKKP